MPISLISRVLLLGLLSAWCFAAGAAHTEVAKVTALIVDHSEARLAVFSKGLRTMWGDHPAPACTLIPVPRLALDGMLFEIEATAIQQQIY